MQNPFWRLTLDLTMGWTMDGGSCCCGRHDIIPSELTLNCMRFKILKTRARRRGALRIEAPGAVKHAMALVLIVLSSREATAV